MKYYLNEVEGKHYIFIDVNYKQLRKRLSSGYFVESIKHWDDNKQRLKNTAPNYIVINNHLEKIKSGIENKIADLKISKIIPSKEEFEKIIEEIVKPKNYNVKKELEHTLEFVFNQWIDYKKKLNILTSARIEKYKNVLYHLVNFQNQTNKKFYLNSLEKDFLDQFQSFLVSQKLRNSTIIPLTKIVKTFLKDIQSRYENITNNHFKVTKLTKIPDPPIVVLTEKELERLINTEFKNPRLERTRDLFVLQTYVLLRVSDFKELGNYNFDITNKQIFKYQTKTGDSVTIPLPSKAMEILQKYNYELPIISEQKYNKNIKDMFKEMGFDNLIEEVTYSGNQKIVLRKPRYEYISSHTARRTGITLLIKRGVPVNVIMKISGHKSIEALMSYVRITKDEAAEIVRNAWDNGKKEN